MPYGLDGRVSIRGRGNRFFFTAFRPALGPTGPPMGTGVYFSGGKAAKVWRGQKLCRYTSTPPIRAHGVVLKQFSIRTSPNKITLVISL
jgi:hypothetical protein